MSSPDQKRIEDKKTRSKRIARDKEPILDMRGLSVTFQKPISFANLLQGFRPKNITAVNDASLKIFKGETLAIVGESGSGKTTLIRAIVRLVAYQKGTIRFKGKSIDAYSRSQLESMRREIAVIFQDPIGSLSPRMTVRKIIAEALKTGASHGDYRDKEIQDLLLLVGLSADFSSRYPHELSGGQARRVCVARALAQNPKLLIADEPTAGLDVSIQGEILNLLTNIQDKLQLPILVVTHNLNVVRHISDRMVIMLMGKIVEEGSTEDIFSKPVHEYTQRLLNSNFHALPEK